MESRISEGTSQRKLNASGLIPSCSANAPGSSPMLEPPIAAT
eukprot:CAMPEP_0115137550 /NCGR_PEP_ID=MMETSP0227-20121206/57110_1 /TAXON_ID=89957 /ORGANISM="Polarella glacialis, Strain CCMP 1383" /LENGTH=41 /DNA_ID= /DNA_START= /DNA_END= /DNA_ORIENTATION=